MYKFIIIFIIFIPFNLDAMLIPRVDRKPGILGKIRLQEDISKMVGQKLKS